MRKVYQNNKTGKILFVLFDVYEVQSGICGIDNQRKCNIKHYTCLDENYSRETTTIDNLIKNYTLIDNPEDSIKRKLDYIKQS